MEEIKKCIVSEEEFQKYFNGKNEVSKEEWLRYLDFKGLN